eukprot:CAMPEP_0174372718 /NCGR_PEP_ID=MMETSP0811_2-20130205/104463_1 /TAXON_ID=73025 ORGANISM="Eutreptiella gymnastica-like, Strain CCMP1594" /NCGR_SAMPLE_ID=MMETSP0811_2 /ASSEMBLY_ACC=CAM_ASM_000667 /LENGTH=167 /DNA_ID=CAMNT_0015520357 /DNA_START=723 /DNA_END=1226 /DNA_ORIENTATION=-
MTALNAARSSVRINPPAVHCLQFCARTTFENSPSWHPLLCPRDSQPPPQFTHKLPIQRNRSASDWASPFPHYHPTSGTYTPRTVQKGRCLAIFDNYWNSQLNLPDPRPAVTVELAAQTLWKPTSYAKVSPANSGTQPKHQGPGRTSRISGMLDAACCPYHNGSLHSL